jgi:hypothetical protein
LALPREALQSQHLNNLGEGLGKRRSIEMQSISLGSPKPNGSRFPIIVAEWRRDDREVIRVSFDRFNGRKVIDVRAWWRDSDDNWKPCRGGLTVAIRHLPDLAAGLIKALSVARDLKLVEYDEGGHRQG